MDFSECRGLEPCGFAEGSSRLASFVAFSLPPFCGNKKAPEGFPRSTVINRPQRYHVQKFRVLSFFNGENLFYWVCLFLLEESIWVGFI